MPERPDLQPCPFCGRPPIYCEDNSYGSGLIFCGDECEVGPSVEWKAGDEETRFRMIEAWNRRADV